MNLYLIGGAPCTGKSTYAKRLAQELNCSWISTDVIRDFMRTLVTKEQYPEFFDSVALSAEEYYRKYSVDQIFARELIESKITQQAITSFIEKLDVYDHWPTYIIEGIALTPSYIHDLVMKFPQHQITTKILFIDNAKEIRNRIFTRGLWDDAEAYPDWIKEEEVKWVIQGNNWFKQEALKYSLEVVTYGNH